MSESTERVLVVDDEESVRSVCERTIRDMGVEVRSAAGGEEALALLGETDYEIVLTDLAMPGVLDGARLVEEVRRRHLSTDVIVMTGYPSLDTAIPTLKNGAADYLIKPFDQIFLRNVLARALERRRLREDLQREKVMRRELQAAYIELQKVELLKEAFLSRVNHELRTPLAPVLMALGPIANEIKTSVAKKFFGVFRANLLRLQETVEDLLLFAELRKERFAMYRCSVDVEVLLRRVMARYRVLAEEWSVSLELSTEGIGGPPWGSPKLLTIAFGHLLVNAIQFNKPGGCVHVTAREAGDNMRIIFEDTGIGIPAEKLDSVFDSFYQAADYLTREVDGLGLGLAIVRQIVEAHGGTVTVKRRAGGGKRVPCVAAETFTARGKRSLED